MEKKGFKTLEAGIPKNLCLMVKSVEEKRKKDGDTYVCVGLYDGREQNTVIFWNYTRESFLEKFPLGTILSVSLMLNNSSGRTFYNLKENYGTANSEDYELSDFVQQAPIAVSNMFDTIRKDISSFDNESYQHLLGSLYDDFKEKLMHSSAAEKMHHNFSGGLLWHMYRMGEMAKHLPLKNYKWDMQTYEKGVLSYLRKATSEQAQSVEINSAFLAERTDIYPVNEKEFFETISNQFADNSYLRLLNDGNWHHNCLQTITAKEAGRLLRALQLVNVMASVYEECLSYDLMAAILICLNLKNPDKAVINLYGEHIFLLDKLIELPESEGRNMLIHGLLSTSLNGEPVSKRPCLPESIAVTQAWEIAQYSCVNIQFIHAACLIHDIGKIKELDTDEFGIATYTKEGELLGHLVIGMAMLKEYQKKLDLDQSVIDMFIHSILSHHSKVEYGTITPPVLPEASIVHHLDYLDSQLYPYIDAMKDLEPGCFSDRVYGINTKVYKKMEE